MCSELDLLLPDTENAAGAPLGAPRTIERSPRNLIGEARRAFDAGLLISCLTVLVTIPDVCSNLIDSSNKDGQRDIGARGTSGFQAALWLTISTDLADKVGAALSKRWMRSCGKTTSPHPISASCETPCFTPDLRSLRVRGQNSRRFIQSVYRSSTTIASWSSDMDQPAHQSRMGLRATAA